MRGLAAAAAGVLALLASGCGGGSGERLSKAEFQSQANAVCSKYQKQLDALPEPQTVDAIPGLVDQALAIIDKEIEEISQLNPPAELQGDFDRMIDLADDTKKAAADLSAAAENKDQAGIAKALQAGQAASKKADELAGTLGLDACQG